MWSSGLEAGANTRRDRAGLITYGRFEGEINPQEFGFGWRVAADS